MTKKQKAKLGLVLLPAGVIVSLVMFWCTGVWPIYKAIQSRNWPQVECVVDFYQTKEAGISQSEYGNRVRYKVDIQYSYQFEGKWYTSQRQSFDEGILYGIKQPSTISKFKTCYVNPDNPSEAVFFKHFNFYLLFLSLLPAIMLGACCYGFYRCLKTFHAKYFH